MSEPAASPPTLRLLEPRALGAADRLGARIAGRTAPFFRALAGGALSFSDRIFRYWVERAVDRPPSAATGRGPSPAALAFPRPWYDEAPAWSARGITLRAPIAATPRTPLSTPPLDGEVEGKVAPEPRAIDFIATYVEPELAEVREPGVRVDASSPSQAVAPTLAARVFERLSVVDSLVRATRSLVASVAPVTSLGPVARPAVAPIYVEPALVERAPRAQEPSAGPRGLERIASSQAPATTTRPAAPAPASIAVESPRLEVDVALAPALPVVWPRTQRFLESLAGPIALAQAGVALPTQAPTHAAVSRASAMPAFTRALVAPVAEAAAASTSTPAAGSMVRATPVPPARTATSTATPSTALAELALVAPELAAPAARPGRLAQRAELLGLVAEQRVARQLGYPAPTPARSVTWSADAFTILELGSTASTVSSALRPPSSPVGPQAVATASTATSARTTTTSEPVPSTPAGLALTTAGLPAMSARVGAPASLLAFVDRQMGPRLLEATRPRPVFSPDVVYVRPEPPASLPIASRAPVSRPAASSPPARSPSAPPPITKTFSVALDEVASDVTLPRTGLGQIGLRSEQLAGEVGIRSAALASEFLVSTSPTAIEPQSSTPAGRLTTSEWVLLSTFPTAATAQEVAAAAVRRGAFQPTASVRAVVPSSVAVASMGAPSVSAATTTALADDLQRLVRPAPVELGAPAQGEPARLLDGAPPTTTFVMPAFAAPAPTSTIARAQRLQRLPDGRAPRGNRLVLQPPTPVVAGFADDVAPTALLAGTEASERRVESPVSAPLWGHLRTLVAPSVASTTPGAAPLERPAVEAERGAPPVARPLVRAAEAPRAPRSAALELIAPFVEAARTEPSSASSFAREAAPVVVGRAPDEATKSLVTALSSANAHATGDRLTMADLTLISIVSAADQVAAASTGAPPAPASQAKVEAAASGFGGGNGQPADHGEVERLAERVFDRLRQLVQQHLENKGDSWER